MALTVTLAELETAARQQSDTESELDRHPQASVWSYINRGLKHFHAEMVRCDGQGYFEFDSTFTTVIGQEFYSLPVQVMLMTKLWTIVDGAERVLYGYEPNETDGLRPAMTWDGYTNNLPRWRIVGNQVSIRPTPGIVSVFSYRYKGTPILLTAPTSTVDGIDGFDEFITSWAAREMAIKDSRMDLAGMLTQRCGETLDRMRAIVKQLNRSQSRRMVDTRGDTQARHYGRVCRDRGWR